MAESPLTDDIRDYLAAAIWQRPSRRELTDWGRHEFRFLREMGFVELPSLCSETLLVWWGRGRTIKLKVDEFDMEVWVTIGGPWGIFRRGNDFQFVTDETTTRELDRSRLRRAWGREYPRRFVGALAQALRTFLNNSL
jgi:hypothetical protein